MEKGSHLLCISLLVLTLEFLTGNALIETDLETVAWQHEEGRLRCDFTGDAYGVLWSKINESNSQVRDPKAGIINGKFVNPEKRFVMNETTYALIISDLVISDEGKYLCHVVLQNKNHLENITHLTVNAMASDPVINKCENAYQQHPNLCTYQATHNASIFNLECKVTGFKPNVSLVWYRFDQRQVPLNTFQRKLPDGTSERIVAIGVSAKNGTDQNFTCSATGEAVTGLSSTLINVLPLPAAQPESTPKGLSLGSWIGIGICSFVVICVISIVCWIAVAVYLRRVKKLPPRGLSRLNRIPCLKVEPVPEPEDDPETIRLQQMTTELEEMRMRIEEYTPGTAAEVPADADLKANINLFGRMSAGKSSLINSLIYAYKGEFRAVAEEGGLETGGGKTRSRIPHPLTDHIRLVDNRGMNDFSASHLDDIKAQIRGERGLDPNVHLEPNKEREVHCAVFVYHHMESHGLKEAGNFINLFNEHLNNYCDRSPLVVITHRNDIQDDLPALRGKLQTYGIPETNIFAFENYTIKSNTEDLAKDIDLLKFLWAALGECDRNLYCLDEKRKETPLKASVKKERHQKRSKDLKANKWKENEGDRFWSAVRGWFGYK